jgi:trimeric autotransporter adhesin
MANQPKKYKKFVATAATATLVASAIVPVASAASLSDIAGNTHEAAITSLVDAGIINGYADGTFKPNKTLTRSDVVKLLGKYLVSEGYSIPSDAVTSPRFSDLTSKSNKELLEYAAVVADAGVFAGSNGKLLAGDPITRENMAIVLVRMVNTLKDVSLEEFVASQKFDREVKDINAAKAEARTAIDVLDFYDITTATNFLPKNSVTRGQFATFLNNVIKADFSGVAATTGTVKAINATTVEVTFAEEIGNVDELKFAIDGLEIKNVAKKQSDSKTVVLTTAAQTAGKEYTVTVNGDTVGKFVGVSAVLPTAIDIVEKSQQSVLGNQVTVKAKVSVTTGDSAAGIPVTFNIVTSLYGTQNPGSALNQAIVAEATTDANGVATYTYTRYASTAQQLATQDEVQAYATGKPAARSFAKVYWAAIQPLTITEVTTGATINNGGKKVYKVKAALEHAEYNAPVGSQHPYKVNLGFKENVNVTPDKAVKGVTVTDSSGRILGYPGQWTTSSTTGNEVEILLDKNGEGTFTLTGSNATVTPFVFVDQKSNVANAPDVLARFDETELFAQAASVTFAKAHNLAITLEAKGVENAAKYAAVPTLDAKGNLPRNTGGRSYVATVADLQGAVAGSRTPVYVSVAKGNSKTANNAANVYVYDEIGKKLHFVNYVGGKPTPILLNTDAKGQVKFKLLGDVDSYATPTVFVDSGDTTGALDNNDLQQVGSIVYFGDVQVTKARLTVDGDSESTVNVTDVTEFVYETVDQNDNPYYIPGVPVYTATFELSTLYNTANVIAGSYGTVTSGLGTVNQDNSKVVVVTSDNQGRASIKVEAQAGTRVTANVSASTSTFPNLSATAIFTNLTNEGAPSFTGKLLAVDTANNRLLATNADGVVYELKYADSELRLNDSQNVDELTFKANIGKVFTYTKKTDTTAAVYNVSSLTASLIDTTSAASVISNLTINADQTPTAKVYDFGGQTLKANIKVNGENVTIKNLVLNGTITVGDRGTASDSINFVDDFTVDTVTAPAGGAVNVIINNGDGYTFKVTNSRLNNVTLNVKEHIEFNGTSSINTVDVNATATGSYFTGTGTVGTVVLNGGATLGTANTVTPGFKVDESIPFSVATTTGDTIALTFTAAVTTSDVAVVEAGTTAQLTAVATSADTISVTIAATDIKAKSFEVTYKGLVYTVAYSAATTAWTVTRKR